MRAARRFGGRMAAFLHLRWKVAARRTKQPRTPSWSTRADFSSAFPMFCLACERVLLAT